MNSYLQNNSSISSAAFAAVGLDFPGLNTNLPPLPHMPLPLSILDTKKPEDDYLHHQHHQHHHHNHHHHMDHLEPLSKKPRNNSFHSPQLFPLNNLNSLNGLNGLNQLGGLNQLSHLNNLNSLNNYNMNSMVSNDSNTQFNNAIMEQLMHSAASFNVGHVDNSPQPLISKCWIKQKTSKSVYKRTQEKDVKIEGHHTIHPSGAIAKENLNGQIFYFCPANCNTDGYELVKSCKNHMKNCRLLHPDLPDFVCNICHRSYCRKDKLDFHVRVFHIKPQSVIPSKKYYKRLSDKDPSFNNSSTSVHATGALVRETIAGEKYYFCPANCDTFGYELLRSCCNHMKDCRVLHTNLPEYRCPKCDYRFSRKSRLDSHTSADICMKKKAKENLNALMEATVASFNNHNMDLSLSMQ